MRAGILYGISGMALVARTDVGATFLVVHDNKNAGEGRAALIRVAGAQQPEYAPIAWPADKPAVDLEGLAAVPAQPRTFLALASAGRVFHIRLDEAGHAVEVLKVFDLPGVPPGSNFESLALQQFGAQTLITWAHRGEGTDPGVLYWGLLDLKDDKITRVHSARIVVPWAAAGVRHVADLKVDADGVVYAASAADAGNDGPFSSTVYIAGAFTSAADDFTFRQPTTYTRLFQFPYHKIEALELVPGAAGGIVFGTDDENLGSWLYLNW